MSFCRDSGWEVIEGQDGQCGPEPGDARGRLLLRGEDCWGGLGEETRGDGGLGTEYGLRHW